MRAAILLLVVASAAFAEGRFEIQPFAGFRFGGTIRSADNDPEPIGVSNSTALGASFAYQFSEPAALEFMWSRQSTEGIGLGGTNDLSLNHLLVNVLLFMRAPKHKFQPFLLGGIGATRLNGADLASTKPAGPLAAASSISCPGTSDSGCRYDTPPRNSTPRQGRTRIAPRSGTVRRPQKTMT